MRKIAGLILAAILGMMAAVPASARTWVKAESAHFTVFSDVDAQAAEAYLIKLEQYRYILGGFYGVSHEDDASTPKLRAYFVGTFGDLRQTWPKAAEGVAGYFKSCAEGEAMVGLNERDTVHVTHDVKSQDENPTQAILFHEYAHDFMFQHASRAYPPWFVEGFAEYYSTTKIQGDGAIVGMAFSWRVNSLMYNPYSIKYEDLLRDTWRPKDGHQPNGQLESAFYAQSWLLSHYILFEPDHQKQFQAFLEAYRAGKDPVPAFEAAFGIKVKDLDHILTGYLNKLQAKLYRIKDMPAPVVTTTVLPPSASKLLLWDAAVRLCPARDDFAPLLANIRTEAAKYPDDPFAQDVLARAEIIIGDEWQALDYLKARVAAHPDDGDAQFMLGQALFLMTVHKHINPDETRESQMAAARQALGKAYLIDPLNAPNLYYYSRALEVPGQPPTDNMISAAMEAQALSPSVDTYAIRAANLLIARQRFDEAKTMLIPLASNPHAPQEAAWAGNVIAVIDRKGSKTEVQAAMRTPMVAETPKPAGSPAPGAPAPKALDKPADQPKAS